MKNWSVLHVGSGLAIGAGAAWATVIAFGRGTDLGLLALAVIVVLTAAGYASASSTRGSSAGRIVKRMLIGVNAGLNAVVTAYLFGPSIASVLAGIVLGLIGVLGAFDAIRQSAAYQVVLGWISWLMPTTWLVNGLGLLFAVVSLILAGVTGNKVFALAIRSAGFDAPTCSLVLTGGALANANAIDTAYDMGHFVFVDAKNTSPDGDVPHETGHGLSLALFGSIVHLIGFLDEMFLGNGSAAWTEQMADSHAGAGTDDTWI